MLFGKSKPITQEKNLKSSSLGSESHGGYMKIPEFLLWEKGAMSVKETRITSLLWEGAQVVGSISSNRSWSLLHIFVATDSEAHLHIKHLEWAKLIWIFFYKMLAGLKDQVAGSLTRFTGGKSENEIKSLGQSHTGNCSCVNSFSKKKYWSGSFLCSSRLHSDL